ncbi:MAG: fibronectin type III domain-containing protein [Bacteroidia bacterium]|nr:fibronectin type III domain-containing protein [Bacteroidia bacterium]
MKTTMKIFYALLLVAGVLVSFTSKGQSCTTPGGRGVTVISATSTQLNWNAVPGAIRYSIEIQNATGNNVAFLLTANVTTNSYTVNGLTAGSNYKFKVRTRCQSGNTPWSPYYFFTSGSGQTQCSVPSGLQVSVSTAASATFGWNAAPGALSYRLRVEDGQNNPVAFLFAVNTPQTSFTVTGLAASTNYKVKLRSNCGGLLHSAWTSWLPFTTAAQRRADLPFAEVQLYPNPATDLVYLVLPDEWSEDVQEVSLTDMTGKKVYSFVPENAGQAAQFEVAVNNFPQGVYVLSVRGEGMEHHQRLSIVH